jgi:hypothetical protein
MEGPRFPFAKLELALMQLNGFPEEWRPKVTARLRQFHKLGFPKSGQKPAGGKRAAYRIEDLCQVGLAFELIQCGVTTVRAVQLVSYFWEGWLSEAFFDAYRARFKHGDLGDYASDPIYLYLDPTDLDGFQKADDLEDVLAIMRQRAVSGALPNIPFASYKRSVLFSAAGPFNEDQQRTPVRGVLLSLSHFLGRLERVLGDLRLADSDQVIAGLNEFARPTEMD